MIVTLYISCYNIADGKFTAFPSRAMIGADIREMKLQNDCDEVQFPEARGGQASSKGIHCGTRRQSGLRRELLQIARLTTRGNNGCDRMVANTEAADLTSISRSGRR